MNFVVDLSLPHFDSGVVSTSGYAVAIKGDAKASWFEISLDGRRVVASVSHPTPKAARESLVALVAAAQCGALDSAIAIDEFDPRIAIQSTVKSVDAVVRCWRVTAENGRRIEYPFKAFSKEPAIIGHVILFGTDHILISGFNAEAPLKYRIQSVDTNHGYTTYTVTPV